MTEMPNMLSRRAARRVLAAGMAAGLALLAACSLVSQPEAAPTPTAAPAVEPTAAGSNEAARGQAVVESVDVMLLESFPVQVSVVASGQLPDTCTEIDEIISQRSDTIFRVAITTFRPPDAVCAQQLVPFEETIPLDVAGLPAGTYTVSVNGVTGSFSLEVDNVLPTEESAAPTTGTGAVIGGSASTVRGFVWHDLCEGTGTAPAEGAAPPDGCVLADDGTLQANGTREPEEPGIPGVEIGLLAGDCTSAVPGGEIFAMTDESGAFEFNDVSPATYCVFLDVTTEANAALLDEGVLTSPTSNGIATNSVTVEVGGSAPADEVAFGYDFRFLPAAEVDTANCTNSFEFVQDLTVPDDTVFPPASEFEASWRLRNNGTCPWTTDYGIAFVGGDPMGITGTVPIDQPVAPGQTADLGVTLVSPEAPGTYRSNWQLSDAAGEVFGVNGQIGDAFWVQIVVEEGAEPVGTPAPGSSVLGGVVWQDVCVLSSSGAPGRGCVETEEGSGFYRADGSLNFGEQTLPGITVILGQGACPPGGIPAPADQLATAVTDEEGLYRFEGLDAGIYCVSIDALSPENVDLLIPGNWTYPAPGTGRAGIRLPAGVERLTVDFGWQYQN